MDNCRDCFSKCAVFRLLNSEERILICQKKTEVNFHPKEVIYKQGSPLTQVLVLVSGIAKIYLEGYNNRNLILTLIQPHEIVAGPGMFADKKHHFSISALSKCSACMIEMETFKNIIHANRPFAEEFIRDFANRTINIWQKFLSLSNKHMHGRIAESLLYLSRSVFKSNSFNMIINREELSEMAGLSKELATRILIEFKKEGIINMANKEIEITDVSKLEKISEKG